MADSSVDSHREVAERMEMVEIKVMVLEEMVQGMVVHQEMMEMEEAHKVVVVIDKGVVIKKLLTMKVFSHLKDLI